MLKINKTTTIFLQPEETEQFMFWRENQQAFLKFKKIWEKVISEEGAGNIVIHFNSLKEIKKREYHIYNGGK